MAAFTIEVVNRDRRFAAPDDVSVLRSAEAAGVHLPFGCRTGACLNCAATLLEGTLAMPAGTALPDADRDGGVFLPCVAVPRSDCRIRVGSALGVLDVPPWTD